jgi:hypothetical protein
MTDSWRPLEDDMLASLLTEVIAGRQSGLSSSDDDRFNRFNPTHRCRSLFPRRSLADGQTRRESFAQMWCSPP